MKSHSLVIHKTDKKLKPAIGHILSISIIFIIEIKRVRFGLNYRGLQPGMAAQPIHIGVSIKYIAILCLGHLSKFV